MNRFFFLLVIFIWPSNATGQIITTFAGNGLPTYGGDGGPAINASIGIPGEGMFDKFGNYYFSMGFSFPVIRMIDTTGIIHTVAGNGNVGFSGDGGLAVDAELNHPTSVVVDALGNLYIDDNLNYRIRKIDAITGIIHTIAGNGNGGFSGDGGPASNAVISPQTMCIDTFGNIYFVDSVIRVRKIDALGIITTVAGDSVAGFTGDGGLAVNAELALSYGICTDISGNLYIGCYGRVRKISMSTGIITTIAGNGIQVYNGDEIPALTASFDPYFINVDATSNLYIADINCDRVFKVDSTDTIRTIAGTGVGAYNGDDIFAIGAELRDPEGLAFDACGNLYIADCNNNRIRKVTFDTACGKLPDTTTAVNNIRNIGNNISVHPNPVTEVLHIDNVQADASYSLLNMVGTEMQKGRLKAGSNEININRLPKGVYVLWFDKLTKSNKVYKIVKQ